MSLVGDRKIYTSERGEKILEKIRDFTRLDFSVIAKIAISLALLEYNKIEQTEYDNNGKNLRGINIFGDDDVLFHSIFSLINERKLEASEFFSSKSLSKTYLEKGLELLESAMEQSNNDKLIFFDKLVSKVTIREDFEIKIKSDELKIKIGKDSENQEDVYLELNNAEAHPNPHLAIIGKSGVGKTQFLFHLLSEIRSVSNHKVNIIFLDYKGDVASNHTFISKGKFKVFSLPEDMLPLNPFQLDSYSSKEIRMSARQKTESFSSISRQGFGDVQQHTLTELIVSSYDKRKTSEKKFPDFKELFEITKKHYEEKNKAPDTLYTIIKDLSEYGLFWNHQADIMPFASILKESFIVDLSKLPARKELAAYLIIESIYNEMSQLPDSTVNGNYREIRTILVIDEAHHYLSQGNVFLEKLIREGRSKGVAVFLASQSPKDFVNEKLDLKEQIEFSFIFQNNNLDVNSVKSLLGINRREAQEITTNIARFKPFQCITKDKYGFRILESIKFNET
ncbi:MAG: hypothetical protein BWK80_61585 [Desulfobacteraceae bacterium IS3]|nr:MAG: hypothetical protein BWK80_61585 [Desulfobacteraceae bacterium IS3]